MKFERHRELYKATQEVMKFLSFAGLVALSADHGLSATGLISLSTDHGLSAAVLLALLVGKCLILVELSLSIKVVVD
jgi:hypothetical protein